MSSIREQWSPYSLRLQIMQQCSLWYSVTLSYSQNDKFKYKGSHLKVILNLLECPTDGLSHIMSGFIWKFTCCCGSHLSCNICIFFSIIAFVHSQTKKQFFLIKNNIWLWCFISQYLLIRIVIIENCLKIKVSIG